ncbi:NAD(P)/FAD-dependent oxidoreductase [Kitasatospora paranensis]|uniref:Pyridine nucleotide-disulfide oxidoreductase domain-containing protein 2 n=1 Tax=Kitasatospora paranensis TaxID=258053 RepID=A0ABW2FSY9_9ACTN
MGPARQQHEDAPDRARYDVVVVGGGHNGLVAAAYLAAAGRSVLVLERLDRTGGAAVSAEAFPGTGARLSRYSYLVSLLPQKIVAELGLRFAVRSRRISSWTPAERDGRATGLLVDRADAGRTAASFRALTGSDRDHAAWQDFYAMTGRVATRVFPSLTEPLPSRAELRRRVDDPAAWDALFERPLGETVERTFTDDLVRGVVLTDALIGTFSHAHDPSLRQNRCFLYHVVGGGTGDWNVPVGGMGALTDALADAARAGGATIRTGCEVTAIDPGGPLAEVAYRTADGSEHRVGAGTVLCNAAPRTLDRLLGRAGTGPAPVGSQLKVNMLLRRLPRLRDTAVDPREAFAGTLHLAEGYRELETAYRQAAAGRLPEPAPSEIYCHSLADPSILGPELAARGAHTLTLFGLHQPADLFAAGLDRRAALDAVLAPLQDCLAEPLADCLAVDGEGRPCVEVKTPLDLERDLGLPGGNIFHRDLAFPYADEEGTAGRWGVATGHPRVLLCGAGAVRGGGVSGIPGHNAAMAVLGR